MKAVSRVGVIVVTVVILSAILGTSVSAKGFTIAQVPKLKGIDYFNATDKGAAEAAAELGIKYLYNGPTQATVQDQIEVLNAFIAQGVDALLVAANDPASVAPTLKKAMDRGITVVTYDADANSRHFFVNQCTYEAFAKGLIDVVVKEKGPKAKVAIVTSSFTAPNQSRWIEEMKKYVNKSHPGIKILTIQAAGEDQNKAYSVTQDILNAYPEVEMIIGLASTIVPGVAQAVEDAGLSGVVGVTGGTTPNVARPYILSGTAKTIVLWSPVDLGYLAMYTAYRVLKGELKPGDTEIHAGRLGTKKVVGKEVLLGPPLLITKDNVNELNF